MSFYEVVTSFHTIPSRFFVVHFPIKNEMAAKKMKRVSYTAGGRLYPTIKNPMSNSLGVLQNGRQTKKRAGNPGLKLDQLFTSHVVMRDSHKSNHLPCHCCSIFVRPESLFVTGSCSKWHRNGAQSISRHNSNLHVLKQNLVITLR